MKHLLFLVVQKLSNLLAGSKIGSNPVIARLYHFLFPKLKPEMTKVGDHYLYLDKNDSLALSLFGEYERAEMQIYKAKIKPGMTVFDIGAFIGDTTLMFAKLVGYNGKVHAFEPDSENYELLQKNIQLNKYNNVVSIPKAVSDTTEKRIFYLSDINMADHSLYQLSNDRKYIEVETITIDDYCSINKCKIDFLKMDIQGAEGEAWLGMLKTLSENPNIIILTEYYPAGLDRSKVNHKQYLDNIIAQGFQIYYINEKNQNMELKNKQQILELAAQIPYFNLLLQH